MPKTMKISSNHFFSKSKYNLFLFTVLIIGFILNFSFTINAQERVDKFKTVKIKKASPIVSNIVGWDYDYTAEKWCGYYNCIINVNRGNNKIPKRVTAEELSDAIKVLPPETTYKQSEELKKATTIKNEIGEFLNKVSDANNPSTDEVISKIKHRINPALF